MDLIKALIVDLIKDLIKEHASRCLVWFGCNVVAFKAMILTHCTQL